MNIKTFSNLNSVFAYEASQQLENVEHFFYNVQSFVATLKPMTKFYGKKIHIT